MRDPPAAQAFSRDPFRALDRPPLLGSTPLQTLMNENQDDIAKQIWLFGLRNNTILKSLHSHFFRTPSHLRRICYVRKTSEGLPPPHLETHSGYLAVLDRQNFLTPHAAPLLPTSAWTRQGYAEAHRPSSWRLQKVLSPAQCFRRHGSCGRGHRELPSSHQNLS